MLRRILTVTVALLLLAFCLVSCGDTTPPYDYTIDMEEYTNAIHTTDPAYLMLANKQTALGRDYKPASLSPLPKELTLFGKDLELESTVALAAEAMVRELHSRGYTDVVITSAYRSYEYQQILFNTYLGNEQSKHPDWTPEQCEAEVLTYSARPGESEHQTGLCMDLISTEHTELDVTFAENPAYAWLVENAHHFGFILRYPADKVDVTGYTYEPWHYRFVGVEAATAIREKGITLEEYLQK